MADFLGPSDEFLGKLIASGGILLDTNPDAAYVAEDSLIFRHPTSEGDRGIIHTRSQDPDDDATLILRATADLEATVQLQADPGGGGPPAGDSFSLFNIPGQREVSMVVGAESRTLLDEDGHSDFTPPIGAILMYAGTGGAPARYLLCEGGAVSRTDYADLFTIIGTTYGAGDGSTTFNLPDLRGRVPAGADEAAGRMPEPNDLGESGGAADHTLTIAEMPAHTHGLAVAGTATGAVNRNINAGGAGVTGSTGGGDPHNNLQPYQVVRFIIRYI